MINGRKKVIVRRFSQVLLRGYLPPTGIVRRIREEDVLELLDLDGREQVLPLQQVKLISFVRDFNVADDDNPERMVRRTFLARPRTEGLWVRVTLEGEEQVEGLAPLDLALIDSVRSDLGLHFMPPDMRGNTQRMYVPRTAISALQIVAVVTAPSKRRSLERPVQASAADAQLDLALPQEGT